MIRRSLRKYKDDDNKDKSDTDSDSENIDSESEEYVPSESDESETEEYVNSVKKRKRKKNTIENDEYSNIKLDEKMLKSNVILVLNNSKYLNDSENEYDSDNEEDNEDNNINENDINESANKKKKYNDILVKYNRDEKNILIV